MDNGRTRLYNVLMGNPTNVYNNVGRGVALRQSGGDDNFFTKRAKSLENAFGTTGAALTSFIDTGIENQNIEDRNKKFKENMNDIYKKYGFNSSDDYYDAKDAAEKEIFGKYGFNSEDYWNKHADLWSPNNTDSSELKALEATRQNVINRMSKEDADKIKKFDTIQDELKGQSAANANEAKKASEDWRNYRENSYVGQKVNQDRGKFAGSAINTLSTMSDVLLPGAGVAFNAAQGGIEGIADELEQNGFKNFDWERAGQNALTGAVSGGVVGGLNKGLSNALAKNGGNLFKGGNKLTQGLNNLGSNTALGRVGATVATGAGRGALSGAVGGATGAGLSAAMNGQDVLGSALQGAVQGAQQGAIAGGTMAGANMAISKTPGVGNVMKQLNEAGDNWEKSGKNFNERLTNTLTSGDSRVGDWLQGKTRSKLLSSAGQIGDTVRDVNSAEPAQTPNKYVSVDSLGNRTEYTPDEMAKLIQDYDNYKAPEVLSGNSFDEISEAVGPAGGKLMDIYDTMHGGGQQVNPYSRESWEQFDNWLADQRANTSTQSPTVTPTKYGDNEIEARNILKKYASKTGLDSEDMGFMMSVLDESNPKGTSFKQTDNLYSRKSPEVTRQLVKNATDLQELVKTIDADTSLTRSNKADLLHAIKRVYDSNNAALNRGGKWEADNDFTSGGVWGGLDRADETGSKYAGQIRDIADSVYDAFKQRTRSGKEYSWDDLSSQGMPNVASETPTTAAGWLKKAGQRVVEDANNRGVGMSIKNVGDSEDIMNLKINDNTRTPETRSRLDEVIEYARNNELGKYGHDDIKNIYESGDINAINRLEDAWREANQGGVIGAARKQFLGQSISNSIDAPRLTQEMIQKNTPQTQVYRALSGETQPKDLTSVFEPNADNNIQSRNKLQSVGEQLQNAAKTQKYGALYDALDAKTAARAVQTGAPEKLSQLGISPENYKEAAKTSNYINQVVSDLAEKSGVKVNAPDLPNRLSADNLDILMSDTAVKKYNNYIKQIAPDGATPDEYSAGYLLQKSRELGNKAANLRGNSDDVYALRQALTDAKYKLRNIATDALEGSEITGDLTNDNIANGLAKMGANEKVQDYYTEAVNGKAPSVSDYIRRSALFEQARDMGTQIDAEKFTRSASKAPTNPMTKIWNASGLDQPVNALLRNTIAPIASGVTNLAGKALEGVGNVEQRINGNLPVVTSGTDTTPTYNPDYNPQTRLYNAIGRTEGLTNAEQARTANYLANAAQEAEIVPSNTLEGLAATQVPNTTVTSMYESAYGQPTAQQTVATGKSYFPTTGDYWTDTLGRAMTSAIDANDATAFGSLYEMYQDAVAKLEKQNSSTSEQKLTATQQRANAAMNSLDRLSGMTPDLGYNLSNIPVIGDIATFGGNDYESEAQSLAQQIGYMVSGANIKEEEAANIGKAYVPQPWDSEQTRRLKLQRAREIIQQYQNGMVGSEA